MQAVAALHKASTAKRFGFTLEECAAALAACGGDIGAAGAYLRDAARSRTRERRSTARSAPSAAPSPQHDDVGEREDARR